MRDRPTLVVVRTHIAYGSPHKQDTAAAHGSPLGEDEVRATKQNLGWPYEEPFTIPPEALGVFRQAVEKGAAAQREWEQAFSAYAAAHPDMAEELQRTLARRLPPGWEKALPAFAAGEQMATRAASGAVLNAIAPVVPELVGGSADLAPSTDTYLNGFGDVTCGEFGGRNFHFGVREHAMGGVLNGITAHSGFRAFGGTFLIFSDYMRPAVRLAALMRLPVIFVYSHDSIGMGEDGPTHQPIEQLAGLRAMPNLLVLRPADANETARAWQLALERSDGPTAIVLSRQKLPVLPPGGRGGTRRLCAGGRLRRRPYRHGVRGLPVSRRPRRARYAGGVGAGRVDALLGAFPRPAARLPRRGPAAGRTEARRRGGSVPRLARVGR